MTRLVRLAASLIGVWLLWRVGPLGVAVTLLEWVAAVLEELQ